MSYPHSRPETIADGIVHAAGLAFALPATGVLLWQSQVHGTAFGPIALYCLTMIAAFTASAIYHLSPFEGTRPLLGRIDHATIYFKISGTYTPLVAIIGTGFAYGVLGVVWLLACIGALAKLRGWAADARGSLALYLGMGWLSVLLIRPMWEALPPASCALVIVGGMTYSLGTIIYSRREMAYQNAIWHSFVLMASICFYAAILLSLR